MTLILRPRGRGNWRPIVVTLTGDRMAPMLFRRGHLIVMGGIELRVSKVLP